MSHGTDKTQSSIPEWARVCPPNAGAAPAGAAPVELTAGRAAMSNVSEQLGAEEGDAARDAALVLVTRDPMAENQDQIVNAEHNARDDSSAPKAVLQEARTLRVSICADAEGGLNKTGVDVSDGLPEGFSVVCRVVHTCSIGERRPLLTV